MYHYLVTFLLFICNIIISNATERFVNFSKGDFLLNYSKKMELYLDPNDFEGVAHAVHDLCIDIGKVCGCKLTVSKNRRSNILIGTLGHSQEIDHLIGGKALGLEGKREKYIICTIGDRLVIAGSDRRGTIYGVYELSRQIGVSPWYYWADVPIERHAHIYIHRGIYTDGEPVVRYRGIFLNDEAPCLTTWVTHTFHTKYGEHQFYEKVFDLILRLKGNFLWPAMWNYAFYADDPENSRLADKMGIIIGTSHHEPMARNHEEWSRAHGRYGPWNYSTNQKKIDNFFLEGIKRIKGKEDVVTIGMRGDGDEAMGKETNIKLLQKIIANQRKIISRVTGRSAQETPQVWALYKEVQDYYDKGMRVPDDVTILLSDDNWGDVRRVPNSLDRKRSGGWGLYYHVDYVGAPRNSKWLNVTPIQNMWEQLYLAYNYGVDRMWVLNVGDLKPMEFPIDFFMQMAWDPNKFSPSKIIQYTRNFCAQQFGEDQADEAARILNLQGKYSGRSTVEMLNKDTYDLRSGEWNFVANQYMQLENSALRQFITLKPEYRDAYRELILFPVQAVSNIYQMYYSQAMNHYLYSNGDPFCNFWAKKTEDAFLRDSLLCQQYNKEIAGGKWDGMMIQKHIGYIGWNDDFLRNTLPKVYRIENTVSSDYIFKGTKGRVIIEAEHAQFLRNASKASWITIPYMGRTLSGISLQPYTEPTDSASLIYSFSIEGERRDTANIHIITKCTLDFLNKGGLIFTLSLDSSKPVSVNFNRNLNENPENISKVYYPTVARRIVDSIVKIPFKKTVDGRHTLTLHPVDPGIVFEKIVVDVGGYRPQFLFGKESLRERK
ncbi:glycosyl hydrolase 115 family protein [Prevotella cerevisiae]|uniref:Glycosyl hydrolase 115 family protein n=1 Tax=Segatella cerevisiae TaxID=2053716 RepID=A0ABT1BTZ6_9BACT|nr:glycosyl hydrolase 115 family protein [Segatella cerevisiae]MCH3994395.1 glycosyl hydrolase 115 family protein [Prevotella sp.]MCO6024551.1 glycosyl hydrolase 115 family protein [Segatella cerevisiae]